MYDSGRFEVAPPEASLEGVQFVNEGASGGRSGRSQSTRTDRRSLDTDNNIFGKVGKQLSQIVGDPKEKKYEWTHCPYCDAPAEPGIRFCLNCKHQFISPEAAAKLKLEEEVNIDQGAKGFSKRAKKVAAGGGALSPGVVGRIAAAVLLIALAGGFWYAYNNGMLNSVLPKKEEQPVTPSEDQTTTTDTAGNTSTTSTKGNTAKLPVKSSSHSGKSHSK
jgi:hypothetical protein